MSSEEQRSNRRKLRMRARRAMREFIHTVKALRHDENTDRVLLAHLFGFKDYSIDEQSMVYVHGRMDDSSKIDQVLTAIINHGKAGFLMYWYQKDDKQ